MTLWRMRMWDDANLAQRFLNDGLIAMSADELGDLSMQPTDQELALWLADAHPDKGPKTIRIWVRYWRTLLYDMVPGDGVLLPVPERRYALGEITGDYRYRATEPDPYVRHVRPVRWYRTGPKTDLPDTVRRVLDAPGTVCKVRETPGVPAGSSD
jgi:predicted Mrr-cat superfamily restriction endonuclease